MMPPSAARLSQWARLDDVRRHAFALAQHHAVGIGGVVVARLRRAQEILGGFREIRRLLVGALERHDAEIVERARMVLGRGALELRLGRRRDPSATPVAPSSSSAPSS